MSLLNPVSGINYNFIMSMYLIALALGGLFAALEFGAKVEAVQGFYLVFAPFVPAALWGFVVRRRWLASKTKAD